jgi:hypothetical protein
MTTRLKIFNKGVEDALGNQFDSGYENNPVYLAGYRRGLLRYAHFIGSAEDHGSRIFPPRRAERPALEFRGLFPGKSMEEQGRIPHAYRGLSDRDGSTGCESRKTVFDSEGYFESAVMGVMLL